MNEHTSMAQPVTEDIDNAIIGEGTLIEPDAAVGYRYHKDCGPAKIGKNCILRKGTIVYCDVELGDYFQLGHYAVIRAKVRAGNYCALLNHSAIEGLVRMGDGVRIMSHVYVPSRTWFGDNVFVGPGVVFMNDRFPGRRKDFLEAVRGATIEDNVSIGGGASILPGITIGARSFVAAGALVNKDVPPGSLVMGVPGRITPLPDHLEGENVSSLTKQETDFWHPNLPDISKLEWPEDWPEKRIR